MEEIWKDVSGYEGYYQVSTQGRIRSVNRIIQRSNGFYYKRKGKIISPSRNNGKYYIVKLFKGVDSKVVLVSRLICQTFIENTENKAEVNHKNGNTFDNRVENLEWCTHSENQLHSFKYLGRFSGTKGLMLGDHPASKSIKQYSKTHEFIREFTSIKEASIESKISTAAISSVATHKTKNPRKYYWEYS